MGLFILRRRARRSSKERPVDLLHDDPDDYADQPPLTDLPQYRPEPFLATEPTEASSSAYTPDETGRLSVTGSRFGGFSDRRTSALSLSDIPSARSGTPDRDTFSAAVPSGSMASRKSPMPRQMRPVNIIQHEDAGPSDDVESPQHETIELPPAYTHIRKTS